MKIPLGQSGADTGREIAENLEKIVDGQDRLLVEVLLPHQIKRLKEISFQALEKEYGIMTVLQSSRIRKDFDIGTDQLTSFQQEAKKIENKLAEDIEKLKTKARQDLLSHLSSDQRAKYDDLHGETFQSTQSDWKR
ncbi:hypothetical protein [Mariniblastus fucicola]|uniref:Uncharacterized protein n=1 Tax=Mariniblastus fucicola TaxID=980251 RepID=A0A5B9P8U1_9BACT|nr:hypothetical protein [Mariniblastus fucicola]QEG21635.1 hypothetical protein MFFC18_14930 [Mariniblastus fucicola]